MAENSNIEWTDHTFNPWIGCTKVSPACKHCYAERDMDHRYGKVTWGPNGTRVKTSVDNWKRPLKWNREAKSKGIRFRVFCASLADVFEDWDGPILDHHDNKLSNATFDTASPKSGDLTMDDLRRDLFELIAATPHLDWLLLTKRPENIRRMWPIDYIDNGEDCESEEEAEQFAEGVVLKRFDNVWIGTSVENQEYADKRIPELLKCRDLSPVLFLSCEPLLGLVEPSLIGCPICGESAQSWFPEYTVCKSCNNEVKSPPDCRIDWVIAGGESGPGVRPSHPDWFQSLRDQCDQAGVPFHFKQWGEWSPYDDCIHRLCMRSDFHAFDEESIVYRVGKKAAGRLLDGVLHDAFPEVSR